MTRENSWYMEITYGMTITHPCAVFRVDLSKPEGWTEVQYLDFLRRLDVEIDLLNAQADEEPSK